MMQTNVEGVLAGGDVVTFPLALRGNKKVNIPHWQMAHVHGKHQERKAFTFSPDSQSFDRFSVYFCALFRESSCSEHDGKSFGYSNGALLLDCYVWKKHTLCR